MVEGKDIASPLAHFRKDPMWEFLSIGGPTGFMLYILHGLIYTIPTISRVLVYKVMQDCIINSISKPL